MLMFRPSEARGHANLGWLDSRHSFSFGRYFDPAHMGFGALRVINEDKVAPGAGFDTHDHQDMEIITYVLDGGIEHKDSLGTGSIVRPGDVQRMTAGTGIQHSEFNASPSEPVHFLQIWIEPERKGLKPDYEQKTFSTNERAGTLKLVGSRDGREGSLTINQDIDLYTTTLATGDKVSHEVRSGRRAWVQVARGTIEASDQPLYAGDGLGLSDEGTLVITATDEAEVLIFDLNA